MMSFEEFQYYIEEYLLKGWKEQADIQIQETKKNNGVTYQGLYIKETEEAVAPCIYLEDFYKEYQKGEDIDQIMERIREEYHFAMERSTYYELDVMHYERMKDRIIFRLVNYEKNKELLTGCPFIRMYDLALTFRWVAHTDSIGISTALITNRELSMWNLSIEELLLIARENTQRIFPPRIAHIDIFLKEMEEIDAGDRRIEIPDKAMYIMTNTHQINGATVLVYEGVLKSFADRMQEDLYVIPSSIHEMILLPAGEFSDPSVLMNLVKEANGSVVSPVDILSDSLYYYNRKKDRLTPVCHKESGE